MADPRSRYFAARRGAVFLRVVVLTVVGMTLAGCTAAAAPDSSSTSLSSTGTSLPSSSRVSVPTSSARPPVPTSDGQAVQALIDSINATAGGAVTAQQALLQQFTHPDYLAQQLQCAPATITIGLDPVMDELMATPGWTPPPAQISVQTSGQSAQPSGPPAAPVAIPSGTLYRLPVLVLVYTDTRRTGTDLTSLRISVLGGRAVLFPLCLN